MIQRLENVEQGLDIFINKKNKGFKSEEVSPNNSPLKSTLSP